MDLYILVSVQLCMKYLTIWKSQHWTSPALPSGRFSSPSVQFLGPALWRLSPAPLFASSPVELMPTARSYTAFCSNFLAFCCINWGTILQLLSPLWIVDCTHHGYNNIATLKPLTSWQPRVPWTFAVDEIIENPWTHMFFFRGNHLWMGYPGFMVDP